MVGVWYRQKLRGTREASNGGRVRVRIIHGLNISHKELTYLLQKSTGHQKSRYYVHAPRGIDWQEKTIARPRPPLIRKTIKKYLMLQLRYITVHHTCMLRDSQTLTQVFLKFKTTQLAQLQYHYLHISKQSSSIKLLLVFNALYMKVFIIPNLDAHHSRTNFITIANTMLF